MSSLQHQDQLDDRYNEDFELFQSDLFQTTSTPSIQFLLDTSTIHNDIDIGISITDSTSTKTTVTESTLTALNTILSINEQTTSIQNSTQLIDTTILDNITSPINEIVMSSTSDSTLLSNNTYLLENETVSTLEPINHTIENISNKSLLLGSFIKNNSDLILYLLNRTNFLRKKVMDNKPFDSYNITAEEKAHHLADKKTMQSLIHLLPPNVWSQIQKNFSTITFNHTEYMHPSISDAAILSEAAAQAGLHTPGTHKSPEHSWHQSPTFYRNPAQPVNYIPTIKPTSTCKTILFYIDSF